MAKKRATKSCSQCGKRKRLEDYHRHPTGAGGRQHICRDCYNTYRRARYHKLQAEEGPKTQICAVCNRRKASKNFSKGNKSTGLARTCKLCTNAQSREKRRLPKGRANHLLWQAKSRARTRGLPFSLKREDILPVMEKGHCEATGLEFDLNDMHGPFSPSLDRKDSSKGYTSENVQVVITSFNVAKNRWPEEQLILILEAYKKHKCKRRRS